MFIFTFTVNKINKPETVKPVFRIFVPVLKQAIVRVALDDNIFLNSICKLLANSFITQIDYWEGCMAEFVATATIGF